MKTKICLILTCLLILVVASKFSFIPQAKATSTAVFTAYEGTGFIEKTNSNSWLTARNAVSGTLHNILYAEMQVMVRNYSTQYFLIDRAYLVFDTSMIPDNAVISDANLSLFYFGGDGGNITIINGQPTYPHYPVVAGDYDLSYYSGNGGSKIFSQGGTPQWNYWNITLTSQGLTWINVAGLTKLALANGDYDLPNIMPEAGVTKDFFFPDYALEGPLSLLYVTYAEPPTVTVTAPANTAYATGIIPVEISASGGTIDQLWYNCKNGTEWIYGSNQTYTAPTTIPGFTNGTYMFYAYANNTDGLEGYDTVEFTVAIPPPTPMEMILALIPCIVLIILLESLMGKAKSDVEKKAMTYAIVVLLIIILVILIALLVTVM